MVNHQQDSHIYYGTLSQNPAAMGSNSSKEMSRLEKASSKHGKDDWQIAVKKSRVPHELGKKMHQCFVAACPDAKMSREKFRTFYSNFFAGATPGCYLFFDHLFRAYDRDGSGSLDFFEFLLIFDVLYCGSPEEKLDLTFRVCDIDNNGTVEPAELRSIIAAMLEMADISDEDKRRMPAVMADSIFAKLDVDGDGKLDKREFIQGCLKEPLIYDIFAAAFKTEELH